MVNTYRRINVIVEEPWQQIVDRRELPPVLRRALMVLNPNIIC